MVVDTLENFEKYVSLHPLFAQVAAFLRTRRLQDMEVGKTEELQGSALFVRASQTKPKTKEEARIEAHREYIDIQIPLSGTETFGYTPVEGCRAVSVPYDAKTDIMFFEGAAETYLAVNPGMFAIFFPQDGHAPEITSNGVKKMIIKVKA